MDRLDRSGSNREARIGAALDSKRWRNSARISSATSISDGEEDELEAKAGDSGSERVLGAEGLGNEGSREAGANIPHDGQAGRSQVRKPLDGLDRSASTREARIGALDSRRSRNSARISSATSLSNDEEDEWEAKAGDSGSERVLGTEGLRDGGFASGELGSMEAGAKNPFDGHLVPISTTPAQAGRASAENLCSPLELVSVLAYLLTFGILGFFPSDEKWDLAYLIYAVIIRYLTEQLFGPHAAKLTSDNISIFIDLPANMLGSFFMGWVGVVFKKNIAIYSEHLAIGLSTGLMGSITTYAAMMQRMLAVMVAGNWVTGIFGLLIGVYLAQMSLVAGVDSALLLHRTIERFNNARGRNVLSSPDNLSRRRVGFFLFLFLGGGLWVAAGVLALVDRKSTTRRTLWFACFVSPPGVWTRWYLARLNGRGIGANQYLKWFPVGTFLVNVTASSLEAGLSCLEIAVRKYIVTLVVGGIQLGTLGCMSTVSTFVAEIQIMHQGRNRWRAYGYPLFSIGVSLIIGILVYGVPVWSKGYESKYIHFGHP